MDRLSQFKEGQKEAWKHFAPLEAATTTAAARLVKFAGIRAGDQVLDVGCGTGVVAVTAARQGARVEAADLTPELLEYARENARIADVKIEWIEADVEKLPFPNDRFDVVVSQFAHIFAPSPDIAISEMLRVTRRGGTIAFSTWPPELLVGRTTALSARYMPPPQGIPSPMEWGDPQVIRERLGTAVTDIAFDRNTIYAPALSPQHFRVKLERSAPRMIKMVESLSAADPDRLQAYRAEYDSIIAEYMENNEVRQGYLLTRARKI